ncbi:MAG TPA: FAD/NAD(P)-binding protein [Candidatus Eisenbacteria bacterium]|nr:FAD/NAD(P)-binding protein [Candidatus Eisenbacteria bacterium]
MGRRKKDRELGMEREITRRDFLNGVSVTVGASLVAPKTVLGKMLAATEAAYAPEKQPGYYPPAKTGLRGDHDGSWEVAHAMRDGKKWPQPKKIRESYDLIVVGGGISGLAAAYFYRQQAGPQAKILVLDNHDDFGGHAKRNEFTSGVKRIIGYGGTQSIAGPNLYSAQAKRLLNELGVEVKRFEKYNDQSFYSRRGMGHAIFFDKETFGTDKLVRGLGGYGGSPSPEAVAAMPLSDVAKRDLVRLYTEDTDYLQGMDAEAKKAYLAKISYQEFLLKNVKVTPEILPLFKNSMLGLYGVTIDAVPAGDMAGLGDLPGFQGLGIVDNDGPGIGLEVTRQDKEPYIYHFPDGNASIARLLVRWLVPGVAPGNTMEDVVLAPFNYAKLDEKNAAMRIRLNSTAVHARNLGDAANPKGVEVTYVRGGQAYAVEGKACILACWNMVIPYLCPEMPEAQKQGLAYNIKVPLVYTNVQIRNWTALDKLKIRGVTCPGCMFYGIEMDFPVSMDGYEFTQSPEQPCVLHMQHVPVGPGKTAREMQRAGRMQLYATSFATFERAIRDQLGRALGEGGFDPARDIEAITLNRWPHGYSYEYLSLFDPVWPKGQAPNEIGRQPFGNIHIANSDAGMFAYTNEAIDQGWRAVTEITGKTS